ncbi:unnamed protein product [Schistosoma haematobium]|nr:unnamed protein product [Schistosoma haematobium]
MFTCSCTKLLEVYLCSDIAKEPGTSMMDIVVQRDKCMLVFSNVIACNVKSSVLSLLTLLPNNTSVFFQLFATSLTTTHMTSGPISTSYVPIIITMEVSFLSHQFTDYICNIEIVPVCWNKRRA